MPFTSFPAAAKAVTAASLLLASGAFLRPDAAHAETAAPDGDGESVGDIVVTAERRNTSLQRTPVAVSAVTSDILQRHDVQLLRDLAGKAAGITLPNAYGNMQSIYIRGIGTASPALYGAVGLYIDDVYIPRNYGNGLFDLPDVQQIEVLRGPQGTLYGQNTSAGAVKIVTREPSAETTAKIDLRVGSFNAVQAHVYVAGEIIPGLLTASIAAAHRQDDGYTYNAFLKKDVDATHTDQGRIKIRLTPADGFSATLSIDGTRDRSDNANVIPLRYTAKVDPRVTYANTDLGIVRNQAGGNLTLVWDAADHLTLKSITAYRGFDDKQSPWDMDGTPDNINGWYNIMRQRQLSQEIQAQGDVGRLQYTVGGVFFREHLNVNRPTWQANRYSEIESRLRTRSYGVYAQLKYGVTDRLHLTLGGRYNWEKQAFASALYVLDSSLVRLSRTYALTGLDNRDEGFTPKVGLDFQWTPDVLLYASWTKGQKSGGFNPLAGSATVARLPVGPENVRAYELGSKATFLDGLVQARVAVFYNDFRGYQASIVNPIVNGQLVVGTVLANAGKAHTYGAEFEASLRPSSRLDIQLAATYLRAQFDRFANPTGAASTNYVDNDLPFSPRFTGGVTANWLLPIPVPGDIRLNTAFTFIGKTYLDASNLELSRVPNQKYLDLGVEYTVPRGGLSLYANVRNVFDVAYRVGPFYNNPAINLYSAAYNPPRRAVVGVRYAF